MWNLVIYKNQALSVLESVLGNMKGGSDKVLSTMHFTFLQDGSTMMSEKNEIIGEIVEKVLMLQ